MKIPEQKNPLPMSPVKPTKKSMMKAIGDAVNGFCDALIDFEPVLKAKYNFNEGDPEE